MELRGEEIPKFGLIRSNVEWMESSPEYEDLVDRVIKDDPDFAEDLKSEEGRAAWKARAKILFNSKLSEATLREQISPLKWNGQRIGEKHPDFYEVLKYLAGEK